MARQRQPPPPARQVSVLQAGRARHSAQAQAGRHPPARAVQGAEAASGRRYHCGAGRRKPVRRASGVAREPLRERPVSDKDIASLRSPCSSLEHCPRNDHGTLPPLAVIEGRGREARGQPPARAPNARPLGRGATGGGGGATAAGRGAGPKRNRKHCGGANTTRDAWQRGTGTVWSPCSFRTGGHVASLQQHGPGNTGAVVHGHEVVTILLLYGARTVLPLYWLLYAGEACPASGILLVLYWHDNWRESRDKYWS